MCTVLEQLLARTAVQSLVWLENLCQDQ